MKKLATKSTWLGAPFTKRWERGCGYGINDQSVHHIVCEISLFGHLKRKEGQSYCGLSSEEMDDAKIVDDSHTYRLCKACTARLAFQNKKNFSSKSEKMKTVKWLNDNNVLISKKLADAMAAFEFDNRRSIDSAGEFVKELVKFTKEAIKDIDNFHHNDDHAEVIYNLISENAASQKMDSAINKMEDDFHEWEIGDEIDNLIIEVIACTVQACKK